MSPVPGPILLLALPLLAAGITYLLRRWALPSTLVAVLTSASLGFLCLRLPLDRSAFVLGQEVAFGRPIVVLGYELILDPAGKAWLAFAFVLVSAIYLFAWRVPQGRSFLPFSLAVLSLYALTVLLQDLTLAVLVFAASTTLTVFILQGGQPTSIRGAQRYLLVALLAVPFLLSAIWLVGQVTLDPTNSEMARQVLLPAALGFGLLLAVFPFGTWMAALAADAPPLATAFVFTAGQAMALFLALRFLNTAPWILGFPAISSLLLLSGLLMALSGGVMAAAQRDFGRLLGYAALSSLGIVLLGFAAAGSQGLTLALLHMINRSVALVLATMSLSILRHWATSDRFETLSGTAGRLPIATVGLMVGGLALAGFPLTAGFPTHWATSRAVLNWSHILASAGQDQALSSIQISATVPWLSALTLSALVASSGGIIIGMARGFGAMLRPDPHSHIAAQPRVASLLVLIMIGATIILGINPDLLLAPVRAAAAAFALF